MGERVHEEECWQVCFQVMWMFSVILATVGLVKKNFQMEKVLFLGPLPPGPTTKIITPDILCENIDEFKISILKQKGLVTT